MPIDLARIIGSSTLRDVENAFTLDHPDERYSSTSNVKIKGDVISVEGELFFRDVRIGDFYRQLHYAYHHGVAEHQVLEIAPAHRGRDIAKHHYRRAIRFYDHTPIREVHLFASGDGPWIWPQLGFDLVSRTHKERLRKIAAEHGFFGLPPADQAAEIYAADIATTKPWGRCRRGHLLARVSYPRA